MSSRHHTRIKPVISRREDRLILTFDEQRVQSEMRIDAPNELVLGYTRTMMGFLLLKPEPAHIAMIGLGGGSLLKYCYARLPDTTLTVVEIDPDVIALRERFCIPDNDERLQVICEDGAGFVSDVVARYDVLMVDGFTRSGQPASLGTQRFYNDCHDCLSDDGILVVNLSDLNLGFEQLVARIRHSFKQVWVIDAEGSTNQIVFAGKGQAMITTTDEMLDRFELLQPHHALNLYRTFQGFRTALG
jgi:spermidine synthase